MKISDFIRLLFYIIILIVKEIFDINKVCFIVKLSTLTTIKTLELITNNLFKNNN